MKRSELKKEQKWSDGGWSVTYVWCSDWNIYRDRDTECCEDRKCVRRGWIHLGRRGFWVNVEGKKMSKWKIKRENMAKCNEKDSFPRTNRSFLLSRLDVRAALFEVISMLEVSCSQFNFCVNTSPPLKHTHTHSLSLEDA